MKPLPRDSLVSRLSTEIKSWIAWGRLFRSRDFWALALVQLAAVALTLISGVNAWQLLLAWWVDSVALGLFNVLRMATLPMGGPPPGSHPKAPSQTATTLTRVFLTGFFALHYGGFQAFYLGFLKGPVRAWFHADAAMDWPVLWVTVAALMAHRSYQYFKNRNRPPLVALPPGMEFALSMFSPYLRVVPMHAVLLLGGLFASFGGGMALSWAIFLFFFAVRMASGLMGLVLSQIRSNPKRGPSFHLHYPSGRGPFTLIQIASKKIISKESFPNLEKARQAAETLRGGSNPGNLRCYLVDENGNEVPLDEQVAPINRKTGPS